MTWPSGVLQQAGPAQFECLIHFTGRPSGRPATEFAPQTITDLTAPQKLDSILWDGAVWGFPPFGADIHHPMVCLSESPPEHLLWLLNERHWQPWGLLMWRQKVYDLDGDPVWHARQAQYDQFNAGQRPWAVRLETGTPPLRLAP